MQKLQGAVAMIELEGTHISLDEARRELARRWRDEALKKKIEAELGDTFMPMFAERPHSISFRQVCPPDNGSSFSFRWPDMLALNCWSWNIA